MSKNLLILFSYFSSAMLIGLLATPLFRFWAFKIGALDKGGSGRRIHEGLVPRLGGAAIFLAFMLPMAFSLTRGEWDSFHRQIFGVLLGSFLVFLIGVSDDIRGSSIAARLLVELGAAILVYMWGIRLTDISNPFSGGVWHLGFLALPATVLWIVIVTNAFNLIDGLDGVAAGTGILVSCTMLLLNLGREPHLSVTFAILIGSLAGFLCFNFPPATIFMGDSGSLFIGFFLGCVSILNSFKATAAATIMIPVIAFSLPLLDMVYAVLRRFYRGIPLGQPDSEHIHHKLLEKGMTRRRAVLVIYGINFVILAAILFFVYTKSRIDYLLLVALAVVAVLGLRVLGYLRFVEFFHESFRHFQVVRKLRYCNYLIRRFERMAMKQLVWEELRKELDQLLNEFEFRSVSIYLYLPGISNPAFLYGVIDKEQEGLRLEFPLLCDNQPIGYMVLRKKMEDHFLCTAELCQSITRVLCSFLLHYPDLGKIDGGAPAP